MKAYRISNSLNNSVYYGMTKLSLKDRFSRHKAGYNSFLKGRGGQFGVFKIFKEVGVNNCKIELLKEDEDEMKIRLFEHEMMKDINAVNINKGNNIATIKKRNLFKEFNN